jgi:hypothetical protein
VLADHFKTFINNWVIESRFYEIPPSTPETPEETTTRLDNARAYKDAIKTLQDLWRGTYTEVFNRTVSEMGNGKRGKQGIKLQNRCDFYKSLMNNPPRPKLSAAKAAVAFTTREQCAAALQTQLYFLPSDQRIRTWVRLFTDDVFATFFERSTEIVDVR